METYPDLLPISRRRRALRGCSQLSTDRVCHHFPASDVAAEFRWFVLSPLNKYMGDNLGNTRNAHRPSTAPFR